MSTSQHQGQITNPNAQGQGAAEKPPSASRRSPSPPRELPRAKVYLDRSRDYSTVHGERTTDDRHYGVMAYQNGLPFNHEDELLYEHPDITENPKNKVKADKLVARAQKLLEKARSTKPDDEDDEDDDGERAEGAVADDDESEVGPVNLNAWARGIAEWPWQEVTNVIARKYSKRVKDKYDALELLLKENVVTRAQLSKPNLSIIDRGYS